MANNLWRLTIPKKILFLLFGIVALVSVGQGFLNGLKYSQDFEWLPTVLFVEGQNPYQYYLAGDKDKRFIASQVPVYAHALYIILYPVGSLSWGQAKIIWATFNISASVFIAMFVGRTFGLRGFPLGVVLLVFLASTPFRNGVGNGQQSTFTLLAFCALLYPKRIASSFWTGFGYIKYSFAPILAIYLFLKRGIKHVFISLLPILLGYFIFLTHVGGDPITVLLQPLKVSTITIIDVGNVGIGDFQSALYLGKTGLTFALSYYVLPLVLAIGVVFCISRYVIDEHLAFALLCTVNLICFRHLAYDYIFLLPAFAYAVANLRYFTSKIVVLAIMFNWFGLKLIDFAANVSLIIENREMLIWVNFGLGIATVMSLFSMNRVTRLTADRSRDKPSTASSPCEIKSPR